MFGTFLRMLAETLPCFTVFLGTDSGQNMDQDGQPIAWENCMRTRTGGLVHGDSVRLQFWGLCVLSNR